MLVLALDTTTRGGSCAVARDGVVIEERAGDAARPHDARLPGDLMALLAETSIRLGDIDVYAVATGPGSFTGLRIGIATMQGLAFADDKPLIGITAFDALADSAPADAQRTAIWIDAWRGDVYAALYDAHGELQAPVVQPPAAALAPLRSSGTDGAARGAPVFFIGDAVDVYRDVIRDALGEAARLADPVAPLLAGTIAKLATARALAGDRPAPHAIRPLYVRRPDAELARDPRPVG
jgi:tRNA threonylcarbamoyladenosine biosynthesis protein TsaB